METYHLAWLNAHPERTEEWLRERLRDGFHVHHVDGNHFNDDPKNLVLIEGGDHMMIHNGSSRLMFRPPGKRNSGGRKKKVVESDEQIEAKYTEMLARKSRESGFADIKPNDAISASWARASKRVS